MASENSTVPNSSGQKVGDCVSASTTSRPAQARPIRNRRWSPNRSAANASAGVTTTRTTMGAAVMTAISRAPSPRQSSQTG